MGGGGGVRIPWTLPLDPPLYMYKENVTQELPTAKMWTTLCTESYSCYHETKP